MWFRTRRRLSFYAHTAIWRLHVTAICALSTVSQRKGKTIRLTTVGAFTHAEVRWQGSRTYTSTLHIMRGYAQMQHEGCGIRITTAKPSQRRYLARRQRDSLIHVSSKTN
jgi:hypothetical protein